MDRPTGADGGGPSHEALDHRRLRVTRTIVLVGGVVGVVGAALVGLLGGAGAAGLSTMLLLWALTAAVAGLQGLVLAVVDEFRRRPASRRRLAVAIGLLVAAFPLLVMAVGAAGRG